MIAFTNPHEIGRDNARETVMHSVLVMLNTCLGVEHRPLFTIPVSMSISN